MTAEDFSHDITANLAEVEAKLCAGSIAAFRDAMVASTAKLQEADCKVAMARRSISVSYLGEELEVIASDATQEWVLRLAGVLKTLAVEEGHLAPTFVESWLQRHPEQPSATSTVPLDELKASSLARRALTG